MARDYETRYGTRSVPVIASHPKDLARTPDLSTFPRAEIDIGMAGQFYAGDEWLQLVRAMEMSGWQIRGRQVRLTVLGAAQPPGQIPQGRMRYLGWQSQKSAAEILSACDVLYCPYPFAPHMREVATLSFPSKLVLYLLAGRPVLFHGPDYSSPAVYLRERKAAIMAADLHAAAIYNALCRLVDDPALYRQLGRNAHNAFTEDFTLESMRASFERALGASLDAISASEPTVAPPPHLPDVRGSTQAAIPRPM
jgi:glycosyltransferase involved in cell wall biosynthesis